MGTGNEHCFVSEELFEILCFKGRVFFGFGNPPLDGEVLEVSKMNPWRYIGFVVNFRYYQFRSCGESKGEGEVPE